MERLGGCDAGRRSLDLLDRQSGRPLAHHPTAPSAHVDKASSADEENHDVDHVVDHSFPEDVKLARDGPAVSQLTGAGLKAHDGFI